MQRWANFVHLNNPNTNNMRPLWPLFKLDGSDKEKFYMGFTQTESKVMKLHDQKRCETWNRKIPSMMSRSRI